MRGILFPTKNLYHLIKTVILKNFHSSTRRRMIRITLGSFRYDLEASQLSQLWEKSLSLLHVNIANIMAIIILQIWKKSGPKLWWLMRAFYVINTLSYVNWHLSRMNKTTVNSHFLYCLSTVFSKGWVGSYCVWLMTASVNFKKK